jgi:steroid 5-alpha reductase family enzyme
MDRAPFIIQCAALYALMSFPVLITSSMQPLPIGSTAELIMKVILGTATVGLASQIVGDTHKSVAKARGETLVTSGLFSVLRHPNYTGETILWVSSAAAGVLAAVVATQKTWTVLALAGGSVFGAIGNYLYCFLHVDRTDSLRHGK